jgi:lysophospholipase L1-like esterase
MTESVDTPRLKRWLRILVVALPAAVVALELIARFGLGLGAPPLSVRHPTIEYMFAPDQDCMRFGNCFQTNAWGMRSPPFTPRRLDPDEFRVMVFGDSVLNGGNLTDQAELATSIVAARLERELKRPVVVGNISAGSWGPGNWLAYAQEYGFFEADCVILVLGSGDAGDCPEFGPLNPDTHPTKAPMLASQELLTRYLPRYLPRKVPAAAPVGETSSDAQASSMAAGLDDLRRFLSLAREHCDNVAAIQFLSRAEVEESSEEPGFAEIGKLCGELDVPAISTRAFFDRDQTDTLFRDGIHPSSVGQERLADAILSVLAPRSRADGP